MPIVDNAQSLELGVSRDLSDYYRKEFVTYDNTRNAVSRVIGTNKRTVEEVIKESIPFPSLWPLGSPRTYKWLRDRVQTLRHYNWELALPWSRWDEEDDVLKDLRPHLSQMAGRFNQIIDQLMADELQQSATLGQTLSTAHDGVALFSALDGDSQNRLGVSGGNIVATSGVATEADIIDALYNVRTRFLNMKDTEDQPFWTPAEVAMSRFMVIHGPALTEVMDRAREVKLGWFQQGVPQASDNPLHQKFQAWENQRITSTTDFYVCVVSDYYKPFIVVDRRMGPEVQIADESNNRESMDLGERAILAHTRLGVSAFAPHAIVAVQ